jgi:hypothetical protein
MAVWSVYVALLHFVVQSAEVFDMEVRKMLIFHVIAHSRQERLYPVVISVSQGRMMWFVVIVVRDSKMMCSSKFE